MKTSHEEYLKRTLAAKKMHLEEATVQHRIHMALYEEKKDSLFKEIGSLERQLAENN